MVKKTVMAILMILILINMPVIGAAEEPIYPVIQSIGITESEAIKSGQAIDFILNVEEIPEAKEVELYYNNLESQEGINVILATESSTNTWKGNYIVQETDASGEWILNELIIRTSNGEIIYTKEMLSGYNSRFFIEEENSSLISSTNEEEITSNNSQIDSTVNVEEDNSINSLSLASASEEPRIESLQIISNKTEGYTNEEVTVNPEVVLVGDIEIEYRYWVGRDGKWSIVKDY
ncbi:hypothetical protein GOQ27_11770, partial [Clostridium sp. D2Q-11]